MNGGRSTLGSTSAAADVTLPSRKSGRLLGILLSVGALAALAGSPSAAQAASSLDFLDYSNPSPVTVGDTGVPAFVTISNVFDDANRATDRTWTVTRMQLTPTCGADWANFNPAAVCPQPQPGILALSATGTGAAGTACAGTVFTITEIDAATGKVSFDPPALVVLAPAETCRINFTFDVLSSPTIDCNNPPLQGNQSCANTNFAGFDDSEGGSSQGSFAFPGFVVQGGGPGPPGPPGPPVAPPVVPQVTAAQTPGTASLTAARGCVRRKLDASVTGSEIAKVTFSVDGERRAADSSAPFGAQIKTRSLAAGTHNLKAEVKFTAASGTPDRTLKRKLLRCSPPKPKFTG